MDKLLKTAIQVLHDQCRFIQDRHPGAVTRVFLFNDGRWEVMLMVPDSSKQNGYSVYESCTMGGHNGDRWIVNVREFTHRNSTSFVLEQVQHEI